MDADQAVQFLSKLGCWKIKESGGWLQASCPLAPWTHSKGVDKRPSFGVSITPDGLSSYKCLGCGWHGDLRSLLWKIARHTGKPQEDLFAFLNRHDLPHVDGDGRRLVLEQRKATFWGTPKTEIAGIRVDRPPLYLAIQAAKGEAGKPLPEDELKKFSKDLPPRILQWLTDPREKVNRHPLPPRGLTEEAVKAFDLRWSPATKRVAIPVRDHLGKLVCVTVRATQPWQKPKFMHSKGFERDLYLFGENLLRKRGDRIVLVEGHFDAMYLWQKGYAALAVMGSHLSWMQIQKLKKWASSITILRDGDKAGEEAAERWRAALEMHLPVQVPRVPDGYDPDEYSDADLWEMLGDPEYDPGKNVETTISEADSVDHGQAP